MDNLFESQERLSPFEPFKEKQNDTQNPDGSCNKYSRHNYYSRTEAAKICTDIMQMVHYDEKLCR